MDKIEIGDLFLYRSKYGSEYIVKVKRIINSTILKETYNLQETSILGENGIGYKLKELTKIIKLLNDDEILERQERLKTISLINKNYNINKQLEHLNKEEILAKFKDSLNRL